MCASRAVLAAQTIDLPHPGLATSTANPVRRVSEVVNLNGVTQPATRLAEALMNDEWYTTLEVAATAKDPRKHVARGESDSGKPKRFVINHDSTASSSKPIP